MLRADPNFMILDAIFDAWQFLWNDNLKLRQEGKDVKGNTYYLTCHQLDKQVRSFALEHAQKKERGSTGRALRTHYDILCNTNVAERCRIWLKKQTEIGKIEFYSAGSNGHEMRYRPAGEPLSEYEKEFLIQKSNELPKKKPVHFEETRTKLLCATDRGPKDKGTRSPVTKNIDEVTCTKCKKIINAYPEKFGPEVREQVAA